MIRANGLVKYYDHHAAVENVSFEVADGENLILLGPSGCGKTTTLRLINRLVEPDEGEVFINGDAIADKHPDVLRRSIGYVLQHHGLFPHYTIAENAAIVPHLFKWSEDRIRERMKTLFSKLNLDLNLKDQYPSALSGGQQQRVGLVRALMVNPPVMLMDEPFGALDNLTRLAIRKEFRELDELRHKTIIMVTHDIQEAFEMGDKICLMNNGAVMQLGTPEELLFKPANGFVRSFLKDQRLLLELKALRAGDKSAWEAMEELSGDQLAQAINRITNL